MIPVTEIAHLDSIRENKLSLVERLADDLAHEIKNPLHSMVINLEVLRRRLARLEGEGTEELLRYAEVLGAELERVNRRVDLLLRLVRPGPASQDLALLAEVIEELRELIMLECERHKVELVIDPATALLAVRVPRGEARQMILTLALRVLDSLPRGGSLRIGAEVGADSTRVDFRGYDAEGQPVLPDPRADETSFDCVRQLAERIGGRLDSAPAATGRNGAAADAPAYVLALPHNRR